MPGFCTPSSSFPSFTGNIDHTCSLEGNLYPAPWYLVFRSLWDYVPQSVLLLMRYLPVREARRFRSHLDYMRNFGRDLLSQTQVDTEAAGKNIMSVLLRANGAEEAKLKLSDGECIDQIA